MLGARGPGLGAASRDLDPGLGAWGPGPLGRPGTGAQGSGPGARSPGPGLGAQGVGLRGLDPGGLMRARGPRSGMSRGSGHLGVASGVWGLIQVKITSHHHRSLAFWSTSVFFLTRAGRLLVQMSDCRGPSRSSSEKLVCVDGPPPQRYDPRSTASISCRRRRRGSTGSSARQSGQPTIVNQGPCYRRFENWGRHIEIQHIESCISDMGIQCWLREKKNSCSVYELLIKCRDRKAVFGISFGHPEIVHGYVQASPQIIDEVSRLLEKARTQALDMLR